MTPVVRVVGLGPGSFEHVTLATQQLIETAPVVRLRTRRHPAATSLGDVASYDEWYERAASFDELYEAIVDDLVALATNAPGGEVLYVVPGSPMVAERTVEILMARDSVRTICEPAVSVIDVACAALGCDPMRDELRVVDALGSSASIRGPGPILILQAYSPEVLATVADRLPAGCAVTVVHHAGLDDQRLVTLRADELASFAEADHLTSLWVRELRDGGVAIDDLVEVSRRLRRECPWDQEQTHASLTRYLLEEAYEALDALEHYVRAEPTEEAVRHFEEELGDLLFQIVFHAELADEEGRFDFAAIADAVRVKLIGRHPHVFAGVQVRDASEVASRWEVIKRAEKQRSSVTDGIAWQLPALTLYTKLLRKATLADLGAPPSDVARDEALRALGAVPVLPDATREAVTSSDVAVALGDVLVALVAMASTAGVDLEGVLRERCVALRDDIRARESASEDSQAPD